MPFLDDAAVILNKLLHAVEFVSTLLNSYVTAVLLQRWHTLCNLKTPESTLMLLTGRCRIVTEPH